MDAGKAPHTESATVQACVGKANEKFPRAEISHNRDRERPANAAPRSGGTGLKAWRLRRVECDETRRYCGAKTASGIEIT
ncbi:hypothetical protein HMPREF0185_01450 [Brevundimonas diminuta 470-4]|nr:hypothetical protein HMPREF0185_01450 [Brevundimonas diminuta 470-4]